MTGDKKRYTDSYDCVISIKDLRNQGYIVEGEQYKICPGLFYEDEIIGRMDTEWNLKEVPYYMRVFVRQNQNMGINEDVDYKVELVRTSCKYGGYRYRFLCPCSGIKCCKLYLQDNGIFACRKYLKLVYSSQNLSKKKRHELKMSNNFDKMQKLSSNIERKYKSGRRTKKYRQYLKLRKNIPISMFLQDDFYSYKI